MNTGVPTFGEFRFSEEQDKTILRAPAALLGGWWTNCLLQTWKLPSIYHIFIICLSDGKSMGGIGIFIYIYTHIHIHICMHMCICILYNLYLAKKHVFLNNFILLAYFYAALREKQGDFFFHKKSQNDD